MQVHQYKGILPVFKNAVVTIGTFDGVHRGHKQILNQLKEVARSIQGETVIITFHPHPRNIVHANAQEILLINTIGERIELLQKEGIDHLVIVPFTEEFSRLTAEEYVESFLVQNFRPHTVIIGYDHRFGHGRAGNYELMESYCERGLFRLREIPAELINDNAISSTRIRKALLEGDTSTANLLLGYNFFFEGVVVEGNKLGRELGYPTANIQVDVPQKLVPGNGIYAVRVQVESSSEISGGMMSIGIRPTINGKDRVIEVNIFNFSQMIYGKRLRVYTLQYLREEVRYNSLDELKEQIGRDKINSETILNAPGN